MSSSLTVPAIFVVLAASVARLDGQDGNDGRPRFDVVSVKPNTGDEANLRLDIQPGGRLVAINIPLLQFVRAAYTLQLSQISGAPSWAERERFDITAITTQDLSRPTVWTPGTYAPLQLMMQGILLDRFKLAAHTEVQEADGYALVLRGLGAMAGSSGPMSRRARRQAAPCRSVQARCVPAACHSRSSRNSCRN